MTHWPEIRRRASRGGDYFRTDVHLRVGKYFGVPPQTLMGLQTEYDLRLAQLQIGRELDSACIAMPLDLPCL
jgi:plasmid maintenance system antidote protein VapI